MARYQIWNHTDSIITPSGAQFSAREWEERYPWCKMPGVKMVISTGPVNGGCALVFDDLVERARKTGVTLEDGMTDAEILAAIEDFEDNPPDPGPTVEERTAAALEFLAMNSLPDEN